MRKWQYLDNELRYFNKRADVSYVLDIGDVEILLDERGDIVQLAIRNVDKYMEEDEELEELVRKIAMIYTPLPKERKLDQNK